LHWFQRAVLASLLAIGIFAMPRHLPAARGAAPALTPVVVATGFMPNVVFAPYYIAQDLGYYRAAGLDVTMNYDRVSNLMQAVSSGQYTFGIASGDSVAIGKSEGANVTYVMAQYQKYPVGAMWLKHGGPTINSPADLKGKNIGISVPGSSTDIGLRALLRAGGLSNSDVKVTAIGFTETEALINRQIDVAMTFVDNEPVQAAALGHPVNVMDVSPYLKLVASGVVTGSKTVAHHRRLVQAFVTATLRGLRYSLQHPNRAFTISMKRQPEITDPTQRAIQRRVLAARLTFQKPPAGHPLGWSSPVAWKATVAFLRRIGMIKATVTVQSVYSSIFTNTFAARARA
jgi:NitT/TauT family transport system substrate-binding protein